MQTIHRLYWLYERNFEAIEMLNDGRRREPRLLASYVRLTREVARALRREMARAQRSAPGVKPGISRERARA